MKNNDKTLNQVQQVEDKPLTFSTISFYTSGNNMKNQNQDKFQNTFQNDTAFQKSGPQHDHNQKRSLMHPYNNPYFDENQNPNIYHNNLNYINMKNMSQFCPQVYSNIYNNMGLIPITNFQDQLYNSPRPPNIFGKKEINRMNYNNSKSKRIHLNTNSLEYIPDTHNKSLKNKIINICLIC